MKEFLVLAIALATGMAHAGSIQLDQQSVTPTGFNDVGEQLVEVSGKCGAAQVNFAGVRQREDGLSADAQSKLTIKGANSTLATGDSDTFFLDDLNSLACIATPKGPMLVLAAWCLARNCAPVSYQVVDATTIRQLTFYDYENECDDACVEKALGTKLPEYLQLP